MLFVHESEIAAPIEAVYAFHERPDALQRLMPPWEKAEVLQGPTSLAPGTEVRLLLHVGPLRIPWDAVHTREERLVLFQDRQARGPFASWVHTHRFLPGAAGGTRLRDEVELRLPLGPLGALAWPLVRRKLERMFRYRHAVTAAACTGGDLDAGFGSSRVTP